MTKNKDKTGLILHCCRYDTKLCSCKQNIWCCRSLLQMLVNIERVSKCPCHTWQHFVVQQYGGSGRLSRWRHCCSCDLFNF